MHGDPSPASRPDLVGWTDAGQSRQARWLSPAGAAAPRRIVVADDTLKADAALRLISEGTAVLWQGDFHNARQLLQALARRVDEKQARAAAAARKGAPGKAGSAPGGRGDPAAAVPAASRPAAAGGAQQADRAAADSPAGAFHRHRQAQAHRARILGGVLVPLAAGGHISLRRAPDARAALAEGLGPAAALLGLDGAAAAVADQAGEAAVRDAARPASAAGGAEAAHALPAPHAPHAAAGRHAPAASVAPVLAVLSLRELQGLIGAHEWRKKGVPIPALGASIHPHHGVFSPVRGEYIDLVARAPLPAALRAHPVALDVGTGTGVLAAVLARRGIARVIATDQDPRALACAADNLQRLGLARSVALQRADLFPASAAPADPSLIDVRPIDASPIDAAPPDAAPPDASRSDAAPPDASRAEASQADAAQADALQAATCAADPSGAASSPADCPSRFGLIVCNPPWVPARPASPIEAAVYDPDSRMLRGFLAGVAAHLADGGEAWLILSDLAEHLGLRRRDELLTWIAAGGLQVLGRLDARPLHPKARDAADPLHAARAREVTSLWRLGRG